MDYYNLNGLGAQVYIDPSQPWLGMKDDGAGSTTEGTKKNAGQVVDSVLNWFNKLAPVVDVVKDTVNKDKPSTTYTPVNTGGGGVDLRKTAGMSTTTKIVVGTGITLGVLGIIYAATKKKKKKS